jgi:hypothetical protein
LPKQKQYHEFPANTLNLELNNQYVTSHFPKWTATAYHEIALRQYFCEQYEWTQSMIDNIWWKAHQKALNYYGAADRMRIHNIQYTLISVWIGFTLADTKGLGLPTP